MTDFQQNSAILRKSNDGISRIRAVSPEPRKRDVHLSKEDENLLDFLARSSDNEDHSTSHSFINRSARPGSLPIRRRSTHISDLVSARERPHSIDLSGASQPPLHNSDMGFEKVEIKPEPTKAFSSPKSLTERLKESLSKFDGNQKSESQERGTNDIISTPVAPLRRSKSLRSRLLLDVPSKTTENNKTSETEHKRAHEMGNISTTTNSSEDKCSGLDGAKQKLDLLRIEQSRPHVRLDKTTSLDSAVSEQMNTKLSPQGNEPVRPTSLSLPEECTATSNTPDINSRIRIGGRLTFSRPSYSGGLMTIQEDKSPAREDGSILSRPEKLLSPPPDYESVFGSRAALSENTTHNSEAPLSPPVRKQPQIDVVEIDTSLLTNSTGAQNENNKNEKNSELHSLQLENNNYIKNSNQKQHDHKIDLSEVKVGLPSPNSAEDEWGVYIIPRSRFRRSYNSYMDKNNKTEDKPLTSQQCANNVKRGGYTWRSNWIPTAQELYNDNSNCNENKPTNSKSNDHQQSNNLCSIQHQSSSSCNGGKSTLNDNQQNQSEDETLVLYSAKHLPVSSDDVNINNKHSNNYDDPDRDEGIDTETNSATSQGTSNYTYESELCDSPKFMEKRVDIPTDTIREKPPTATTVDLSYEPITYKEDVNKDTCNLSGSAISKHTSDSKVPGMTSTTSPVKPARKKRITPQQPNSASKVQLSRTNELDSASKNRSHSFSGTTRSSLSRARKEHETSSLASSTTGKQKTPLRTSRSSPKKEAKFVSSGTSSKLEEMHKITLGSASSIESSASVRTGGTVRSQKTPTKPEPPKLRTAMRTKAAIPSSSPAKRPSSSNSNAAVITPTRNTKLQNKTPSNTGTSQKMRLTGDPKNESPVTSPFIRNSAARTSFQGDSRNMKTSDAPKIAVIKRSPTPVKTATTTGTPRMKEKGTSASNSRSVRKPEQENQEPVVSPLRRGAPERRTISGFSTKHRTPNKNPGTQSFWDRMAAKSASSKSSERQVKQAPQKTWC